MRILRLLYSIPFLVVISCGSYQSVKHTGKLAQELNDYKEVYSQRPCDVDHVFTDAENGYCEQFDEKESVRIDALDLLIAYGVILEKFVEDSDMESGDQIEVLLGNGNSAGWTSLDESQISGAKKIVDAIHSIATNSIKRKALNSQIKENNNSLQMIVSTLKEDLNLRIEIYNNVLLKMKQYFNEDSGLDADRRQVLDSSESKIGYVKRNRLDEINIRFIENHLKKDMYQISNTIKALTAFGNAHQLLAENFGNIGTKSDYKVVGLIMKDLKNIYTGFQEIK